MKVIHFKNAQVFHPFKINCILKILIIFHKINKVFLHNKTLHIASSRIFYLIKILINIIDRYF